MLPVAAASRVCRPDGSLPVSLSADYRPDLGQITDNDPDLNIDLDVD